MLLYLESLPPIDENTVLCILAWMLSFFLHTIYIKSRFNIFWFACSNRKFYYSFIHVIVLSWTVLSRVITTIWVKVALWVALQPHCCRRTWHPDTRSVETGCFKWGDVPPGVCPCCLDLFLFRNFSVKVSISHLNSVLNFSEIIMWYGKCLTGSRSATGFRCCKMLLQLHVGNKQVTVWECEFI